MAKDNTLTSRQQAIYDFLKDKIRTRGYGPTVREIGAKFGIRSPNGVMCHLKALEKKGLISRESHMSRAIQLSEPISGMTLPLAGRIAAGSPIEAVEQTERVDFSPLFEPSDHFCLKVAGQSMIEAQIVDGDFGDRGSWYQSRSYGYTSRYPFSSTQVPAYRYPFSREYYSYGPGYSNYGYAFGYPYGWYGGWHPGWPRR